MSVMPPPGWAIAAASLVAVFNILAVAVIAKTPQGYDKHYAHFFAGIMAGIGGVQLGLLLAYMSQYTPGSTYTWSNSTAITLYILGEWVLVAMAFTTTLSRQDKFPSTWPRLEFALQGFASLYLVALSCNQLAAIAPTRPGRQDALRFGEFLFAVTTIILLMTAAGYLSMWTERRFFATTTAAADDNKSEKPDKINMTKQLNDEES